jgi:hypothetical protein
MNVLQIGESTHQTPEDWPEVTHSQALDIAEALTNSTTVQDFKSRLMLRWLNLEGNVYAINNRTYVRQGSKRKTLRLHRSGKAVYIADEDWALLCETLNWMFENRNKQPVFHSKLTLNPIPVIRLKGKTFYGPDSLLTNSSAVEYAKADTRRVSYAQTNDPQHLHEMMAALYRPPIRFRKIKSLFANKPFDDIRQPFADAHLKNADIMKHASPETKQAVLLFFDGCNNVFHDTYSALFSEGESGESGKGWAAVFQQIASHVTNIEQVMEVNIHTLLFDLNERILNYQKNKQNDEQQ